MQDSSDVRALGARELGIGDASLYGDKQVRRYLDRKLLSDHLTNRVLDPRTIKPSSTEANVLASITQGDGPRLAQWYNPSDVFDAFTYSAAMYATSLPNHATSGTEKVGRTTGTWAQDWEALPADEADSMLDLSTNRRINILKDGIYVVELNVAFSSITVGKRVASNVYVNGAPGPWSSEGTAITGTYYINSTFIMSLGDGDYIEPYVFQNDSTSEAYNVSSKYYNRISATRIGPSA